MSHMSDSGVEALSERAAAAGMAAAELRAWRHAFKPAALDTCGCKASAKAAAVTAVLATILILVSTGGGLALLWALAAAFTAAVIGKALGQHAAERRRSRLLVTFEERIREIGAE